MQAASGYLSRNIDSMMIYLDDKQYAMAVYQMDQQ